MAAEANSRGMIRRTGYFVTQTSVEGFSTWCKATPMPRQFIEREALISTI
ncbi:hypothetical protein IVB12_22950 [Bradyrhizobium sp. 179]|nr:hypothetical protein [Bradyrhizobium sp. 179]MCK1544730.1 hypothetical protein [Bradyrhizobium sp. 179]